MAVLPVVAKDQTRRSFLKQVSAGSLTALLAGCGSASLRRSTSLLPTFARQDKNNVLVLMSDEHNPFYSGLGPYKFVQTPNLNRLAERGVVFANAYCPSPVCHPSRSAFCAGLRIHQLQTYSNCNVFQTTHPSYGKVLAENGIHSVHIGKTDFYAPGTQLGFSEMIAPIERLQPNPFISRRPLAVNLWSHSMANGYGVDPKNLQSDTKRIDEAIHWLRNTAPTLSTPWVCVVNLIRPHFPHKVTESLWKQYELHTDLPRYGAAETSANHPYALDLRTHFQADLFSETESRGLRRGYFGCVSFVDQQLGRIMEVLDQTRLSDNTIVAYTSDHGELLGKFGMWWKCSLYEDSVRVPLVVAGPGFPRQARVETPVDLFDLQATLFEATGTSTYRPREWIGTPLQEIPPNDPDRVIFSEYHGHGTRASAYLVRKGDWKLLYYLAASNQLFNLREDPDELTNLADQNPEKVMELEGELWKICNPITENKRAEEMIQTQLAEMDRRHLLPNLPEEPPLSPADYDGWMV